MLEFIRGEVNLQKLEVSDITDIKVLQEFLDNFALGMNCAAVSVDRDGNEITKPSYYRYFCNNFIQNSYVVDNIFC